MSVIIRWLHMHNDHCAAGDLRRARRPQRRPPPLRPRLLPLLHRRDRHMKRFLSPSTNPGLYTALASLALSVWQAVQVQAANGPLTWSQVGRVAAPIVIAALVQWQRSKTTPVKDPRDANGVPLKTANAHAADNFQAALKANAGRMPGELSADPTVTTTGGAS